MRATLGRLLALTIGVTLLMVDVAGAHAELERATPAPCSSVGSVSELELVFSTELGVEDSGVDASIDGELVARAGVDLSDLERRRVVVALPNEVSGIVEVEWQSRSATDDDENFGRYQIAVGPSAGIPNCEATSQGGASQMVVLVLGIASLLVFVAGIVTMRRSRAAKTS